MLEFLNKIKSAVAEDNNEVLVDLIQDLVFIGMMDSKRADALLGFGNRIK